MGSLLRKFMLLALLTVLPLSWVRNEGLAQAVADMKSSLGQLKPLLQKEGASIDTEVIWSNALLSIAPVSKDPSVRTDKGAAVGMIYAASSIESLKLGRGIYLVRLRRLDGSWEIQLLGVKGEVVNTIRGEAVDVPGEPFAVPTVFAVPDFKSRTRGFVLLWCWDNFCVQSPRITR